MAEVDIHAITIEKGRTGSVWSESLRQDGVSDLARSGISVEAAEACGIYAVDDAREAFAEFENLPALVLPYYDPHTGDLMEFERGGQMEAFARVRYLSEPVRAPTFAHRKMQRYGQPVNSGVFPYFPIGTPIRWADVLADRSCPIVITEGEKKAVAACLAGVPTVGLGGVYNFMQDGALLAALDAVEWKKRPVYICFDSDAADNPQIQAAEGRLASELSVKRSAAVYLVRLPSGPRLAEGKSEKLGIDDFILQHGRDAFIGVLEKAPQMRKIDAAVLALNESVAWIEREGKVYDLGSGNWMAKDAFGKGSKYSALKVIQPTLKGTGVKEVSVAEEWLTHPHAHRYEDVVFRPDTTDSAVASPSGGLHLNLWKGFDTMAGDPSPFLELGEYVFSSLPRELRDFPLKLMAYKFQNPGEKIPLALVLVGLQGSGKSLWAKMVREAAGDYGVEIPSKALLSDYNGWVEKALIGVINEAKPEHVNKGAETLKRMISEDVEYLNDKYRIARQVRSYTSYILTANDRRVGAYDADDRRMFVSDCGGPHPDGKSFYIPKVNWLKQENGPAKIRHFLLEYDLKGWTPPSTAPLTTEKYMARAEASSPIERLAEDMRTADQNTIVLWITTALASQRAAEVSNDSMVAMRAREVIQALSSIQIRPFYTPEELAAIFPMIAQQFYNNRSLRGTPAGEISRQLRECGVPYLPSKDDPRGFRRAGRLAQYLVIADPEDWKAAVGQADFDRLMDHFPRYSQFITQQK